MQGAQRVHFIGIGGYGMSGLALVLLRTGFVVSGSDARHNARIDRLVAAGASIHIGHDPALIQGADTVVYSTDVPADNPELAAARSRGLQVLHRSEVLAHFINRQAGIAITGTHGKTTTTAMVALILEAGGLDPTVLIGGEVAQFGGNAKVGSGAYVAAEADESDGSFLRYFPAIAVITNIEPEHLEHYGGDFDRVRAAYRQFAGQVRSDGLLVVCVDDPEAAAVGTESHAWATAPRLVRYGLTEGADWSAWDIQSGAAGTTFTVLHEGAPVGTVALAVPGRHNVNNALAALAVGDFVGVPFMAMAVGLAGFRGAGRRFERVGQVGGVLVVDDYAHHPTEIRATLLAAREVLGLNETATNGRAKVSGRTGSPTGVLGAEGRRPRVIAVFQPQRFTRTFHLMSQFEAAFDLADILVLTDIYSPAGEKPIPGVSSQVLAERIARRENRPVQVISDPAAILAFVRERARPGDLVLTMGAGDIWKVAAALVGGPT